MILIKLQCKSDIISGNVKENDWYVEIHLSKITTNVLKTQLIRE